MLIFRLVAHGPLLWISLRYKTPDKRLMVIEISYTGVPAEQGSSLGRIVVRLCGKLMAQRFRALQLHSFHGSGLGCRFSF